MSLQIIASDLLGVEVDLASGASLTRIMREIRGQRINLVAPGRKVFGMVPWPGRIRTPKAPKLFLPGEQEFVIERHPSRDDPKKPCIHGIPRELPFEIVRREDGLLVAENKFDPDSPGGKHSFPTSFSTRFTYTVAEDHIDLSALIKNTGKQSMPVGGGFHTFFPKQPFPDRELPELRFQAQGLIRFDPETLVPVEAPIDEIVSAIPSHQDYSNGRRIELDGNDDQCYTGFRGAATYTWKNNGLQIVLTDLQSNLTFAHLWTTDNKPDGLAATALELQTQVANANYLSKGRKDPITGSYMLRPGSHFAFNQRIQVLEL